MDFQEQIAEIKKVLETAKNIFVLLPQNANFDATAAALSFYLSLKASGKNVLVGSPTQMRVEYSRLVGIDKVSDKIGNRNLIISFDYKEESIEKVSYNVEGDKFNLVVQPRAGFPPLSRDNVTFSYEGIEAELIFVIGAPKLEALGDLYEKNRSAFTESTIVDIDRSPANSKFGQINLVDSKSSSITEIIYSLIKNLSLSLNADIAGNLLKGLEDQTQNFQAPFADVSAFETAAELMRAGAKRSFSPPTPRTDWSPMGTAPFSPLRRPTFGQQMPSTPAFSDTGFGSTSPTTPRNIGQISPQPQAPSATYNQAPAVSGTSQLPTQTQGGWTPSPTQGQVKYPHQKKKHLDKKHVRQADSQMAEGINTDQDQNKIQPQEDWLKPKIYKGKTEV